MAVLFYLKKSSEQGFLFIESISNHHKNPFGQKYDSKKATLSGFDTD